MCDQWLSEDKFDGQRERVLPEIKEAPKYQELFMRMKLGGVLDKHVVMTLFRKAGQSTYTRVQVRITFVFKCKEFFANCTPYYVAKHGKLRIEHLNSTAAFTVVLPQLAEFHWHGWIGVVLRAILQRCYVCVAMFFLVMVCNAMWFGKGDDLPAEANFKIDFGPISMTWFQLYSGIISILITYPCIFISAEIFRRTKKWHRRPAEDAMASQRKEIMLPSWFVFFGWLLLLSGMLTAAFFTFLYR